MIDLETARSLINEKLSRMVTVEGPGRELVPEITLIEEHDFGWLFYYGCKDAAGRFVDVAGNAPYIFDKRSGEIFTTGTALSQAHYVKNYMDTGDPHRSLGSRVRVCGWVAGAIAVDAMRAIRQFSELGLRDALHCVNEAFARRPATVETTDNDAARQLVDRLTQCGFKAERLPELR